MKEKAIYKKARKLGVKYVVAWFKDADGEFIAGITDIQQIHKLVTSPTEFKETTIESLPERIHYFAIERNKCDTFFVSSDGSGIAYSSTLRNYSADSFLLLK